MWIRVMSYIGARNVTMKQIVGIKEKDLKDSQAFQTLTRTTLNTWILCCRSIMILIARMSLLGERSKPGLLTRQYLKKISA